MSGELRVEKIKDGWAILREGSTESVQLFNDYLAYLADRRYSDATVRNYAFDLLHFARWLSNEGLRVEAVDSETLLRYMAASRSAQLPGQDVKVIPSGRATRWDLHRRRLTR